MTIEEFPDPSRHRICSRCQKWYEPEEGVLVTPEITGPLSAMKALRATITDNLRFECHRCVTVRKIKTRIIWGTFAVIIVIVLILQKLKLLQ